MTMSLSAPMATTYAAPQMSYAPAYGGYPTMQQQPMLTTETVEKQRLEATQQLTTASTAQEKMMKDQLAAQLQMLDAETARQIELTKQTYTQQTMALTMQQQQQTMMIEQQAAAMQSQAAQYKMQADMQKKMAELYAPKKA